MSGTIILAGLALAGCSSSPPPAAQTVTTTLPAQTVTATPSVTVTAPPVTKTATVTYTPPPPKARQSFQDGSWSVGQDVDPGTYRVTAAVADGCYWAITTSGSNGSDIVANNNETGGFPRVTLKSGQDVESSNCGTWVRQG